MNPLHGRGRAVPAWRAVVSACLLLGAGGCRRENAPAPAPAPPSYGKSAAAPIISEKSLHLNPDRETLTRQVIENMQKPVTGRRASLPDVERIVHQVRPLIEAAAQQPDVQEPLRLLAQDEGISLDEARRRWMDWQEADILLESGGDPEDVSSANAVGVAQWIAETGQRAGLKIDVAASKALTVQIDALKRRIAWLAYLNSPETDPHVPGAPSLTKAEAESQLPALHEQLERLRADRRRIDERYDPPKAVSAHTRYLLGLYPRFPDLQWVFQAFHGGEAGVERTLKKYLGSGTPGSTAQAIRHGNAGKRLTYAEVYFTVSPRSHPDAFSYLYGRGDDHRHYWWKMCAARDAFTLFRRDEGEFRRKWESFLPGRPKEAMWYPDAPTEAYRDLPGVQAAVETYRLLPVLETKDVVLSPVPGDPQNTAPYQTLKPESLAALRLVLAAYRKSGGTLRLTLGDLTRTLAYDQQNPRTVRNRNATAPPDPSAASLPGGGPPADFDYHTTGLAFDIVQPTDREQRKRLEYALDYLANRQVLWAMIHGDRQPATYHIVPSPRYALPLQSLAAQGSLPLLSGF